MKISAAELRAMGAEIDSSIPDCATIPRALISMTPGEPKCGPDGLVIPVTIEFLGPFTWVEGTIEVKTS